MPFLCIVIPTRNRPESLRSAISSVLSQDLTDFRLIVSDNSDPDQAEINHRHVNEIADSRVQYVRPERALPMAEHWDWALRHATGAYVGILTDRMVFKHFALRLIAAKIRELGARVLVHRSDWLRGTTPPFRLSQRSFT